MPVKLLPTFGVAIALLLAPGPAGAGVTYDFAFRSVDVNGAPIAGGTATGTSFEFVDEAAAQACNPGTGTGCPVLDVIVRHTDSLAALSVSVGFDASQGLAAASAVTWLGVQPSMVGNDGFSVFTPTPVIGSESISSFDGAVNQFTASGLAAGTYHIGTVVWDTSAATAGVHAVQDFQVMGLDATGLFLAAGGNVVDVTGSESLASGALIIQGVAEVPGISALGAGVLVVALVLVARRRL